MQAQKEKQQAAGQGAKGPKKTDSGMGNVQDARREMTKTKEQLEEEKKISLSIRIKPLDLDAMDGDQLTNKASELSFITFSKNQADFFVVRGGKTLERRERVCFFYFSFSFRIRLSSQDSREASSSNIFFHIYQLFVYIFRSADKVLI